MKYFLILFTMFSPLVSQAASVQGLLKSVLVLMNGLIPVIFGLAVLVFMYGLATRIMNSDNEEKRNESKRIMFWGIIALFVMASVWGLVLLIQQSFQIIPGPIPEELRDPTS